MPKVTKQRDRSFNVGQATAAATLIRQNLELAGDNPQMLAAVLGALPQDLRDDLAAIKEILNQSDL